MCVCFTGGVEGERSSDAHRVATCSASRFLCAGEPGRARWLSKAGERLTCLMCVMLKKGGWGGLYITRAEDASRLGSETTRSRAGCACSRQNHAMLTPPPGATVWDQVAWAACVAADGAGAGCVELALARGVAVGALYPKDVRVRGGEGHGSTGDGADRAVAVQLAPEERDAAARHVDVDDGRVAVVAVGGVREDVDGHAGSRAGHFHGHDAVPEGAAVGAEGESARTSCCAVRTPAGPT